MRNNFKGTDPDAYVDQLDGWRRETVEALRAAVLAAGGLEERIKWGHLVYLANGPVCLIRAEADRVLLGYWRGRRLVALEPRLKPGGKFDLANVSLTEGEPPLSGVTALTTAADALNADLGNPTRLT